MPYIVRVTLRRNPEKMLEAAAGEYQRRGRPVEWTQWSLRDIHAFMSYQNATRSAGDEVGGYARFLPKAQGYEPAQLPQAGCLNLSPAETFFFIRIVS